MTPENGSEYARGENIEVYVNASDEDDDIAEVRLYLDGFGITSILTFPFSYTLETAELEVGTHSLKAEVIDGSGKEAENDVSFVITTGLPEVETLQPVFLSNNSVIVGGTIIDDGGGTILEAGILSSKVPYGGEGTQEVSAEVHDSVFSVTLTNLEHITYYITAFAENEGGRSYGEQVSFTVPIPPIIEILEPSQASTFTQGDTIEIHVNATDEDGSIEEVRYYINTRPVAASDVFPYTVEYSTAGLSIGMHFLKVEAEDNSGIKSEDEVYFLIH